VVRSADIDLILGPSLSPVTLPIRVSHPFCSDVGSLFCSNAGTYREILGLEMVSDNLCHLVVNADFVFRIKNSDDEVRRIYYEGSVIRVLILRSDLRVAAQRVSIALIT
jgi:hypothetical protein